MAGFLSVIYFLLLFFTLPHYGINWDTINHLPRGQAYLHYFLTGERRYESLPTWKPYWQKTEGLGVDTDQVGDEISGRSYYQLDSNPFEWYLEIDGDGHPPLSDILSAVFNRVLFGELRLVNDIDAYRVYGVVLAASLVGLVYYWIAGVYGGLSGLVAALSLATYPLFWSESHFNTEKDVPETVYWTFMIYCVWRGVTQKNIRWTLLSGVFFGLALGTKFNVLFVGLVIVPWLTSYWLGKYWGRRKEFWKENRRILWVSLGAILLGGVIFVGSWPYLWFNFPEGVMRVFGFYRTIGMTTSIDPRFVGKWVINTYPIQWILYTTYIPVLVLAGLGVVRILREGLKEKTKLMVLMGLMLFVPVARVSVPGVTIYGGIRQIMEYVPALSIMVGLGAGFLTEKLKKRLSKPVVGLAMVIIFVPHVRHLVRIHPNENVYFNSLIGGLAGAKESDLPAWGNSFGAAYRQGVGYINENAEEGARVVYAFELIPNVPRIWYRQDLTIHNSRRSGYLRKGEYAITLTYQGTSNRSYYDMYLEGFLTPVYETSVDGVSILKVWRNDEAHLKRSVEEELVSMVQEKTDFGVRLELNEPRSLSRLELKYSEKNCNPVLGIYVQISLDGKSWARLPGSLPEDWLIPEIGEQPMGGGFIEPFVGQEVKYIDLVMSPVDACLSQVLSSKLYVFKESEK